MITSFYAAATFAAFFQCGCGGGGVFSLNVWLGIFLLRTNCGTTIGSYIGRTVIINISMENENFSHTLTHKQRLFKTKHPNKKTQNQKLFDKREEML